MTYSDLFVYSSREGSCKTVRMGCLTRASTVFVISVLFTWASLFLELMEMSRLMTKLTKWHVRPAKTQISPVWSESLLSAWRKLGSLATHWAHSEDSDQTGQMPRLIWVFSGRTCHFVGFVMRRLKWVYVMAIIALHVWGESDTYTPAVYVVESLSHWFSVS